MSLGEIIIANDLVFEVALLKDRFKNLRIFPMNEEAFKKGDFKVEDARDAIEESYISSNETKVIVLVGDRFNVYAQNALLKVLEEPPKNIHFVLVTRFKTSILPTILSRMLVTNKKTKTPIPAFEIDIAKIDLAKIDNFLSMLSPQLKKEDLRQKVSSLLFAIKQSNLNLNKDELDYFNQAFFEIDSYEQPKYIFLKLLLMLLKHRALNKNKS